ncbi:hypothetical protein [Litchfieldella anticariensis]|nr:hypothetical protein [Halomonas anticariensis]
MTGSQQDRCQHSTAGYLVDTLAGKRDTGAMERCMDIARFQKYRWVAGI